MFFNIQRWSLHDGPGIRTTIFFRGCPLRCRWCSNPESWSFDPAPEDPGVEAVLDTIARDAVFYRASGGGITFSGGEPFASPKILETLADAAQAAGIETAAETSGYFDFTAAAPALSMLDHLFVDLKHMDDRCHRELTGVSNKRILENILRINDAGPPFVIRIPLVKGMTDDLGYLKETARFCRGLDRLKGVELLPFHPLGEGKYSALGLPFDRTMAPPDPGTIDRICSLFHDRGIAVTCAEALFG